MTAAESTSNAAHDGVHLVILHHGLWGNKGHVKFIADQFKKRFGDRILVYRAESNESSLTYDGIDICAQRAVEEIHEVIRVIEDGGNIKDLQGRKNKGKQSSNKNKKGSNSSSSSTSSANSSPSNSRISSKNNSHEDLPSTNSHIEHNSNGNSKRLKKVTQFSFLGYSLGGLIGRFVLGMLDMAKFFDPVEQGGRGIEPMYFVTMATPHLGIRMPSGSTWSKMFNYLSSRMLSRTGEQMQLIDEYIPGKPLLLVMSEADGLFIKALSKFKRRAVYCNIRNDRSVPFWTASFSDADPFHELDAMEIQYNTGYSSLIESFEHYDAETLVRVQKEREASLKAASYSERASKTLKSLPWRRYVLFGLLGPILIPVWIMFASTTIGYQGLNSRRRTKDIVATSEELNRIKERASTTVLERYRDDDDEDNDANSEAYTQKTEQSSHTQTAGEQKPAQPHTVVSVVPETPYTSTLSQEPKIVSYSFPDLKEVQPLGLIPVQVEISRNLNKLEWKKNI
ncbi:hypothetical protein BGZ98_002713, partial [Dissophora globulifera]